MRVHISSYWALLHRSVVFVSGFFSQREVVLGKYSPLLVDKKSVFVVKWAVLKWEGVVSVLPVNQLEHVKFLKSSSWNWWWRIEVKNCNYSRRNNCCWALKRCSEKINNTDEFQIKYLHCRWESSLRPPAKKRGIGERKGYGCSHQASRPLNGSHHSNGQRSHNLWPTNQLQAELRHAHPPE